MLGELILFAIIGLGAGVAYAGLGLGLVATYRGTGVVNFAHAAIAMWGAYVYVGLRTTGTLHLPVVGMPDTIDFGAPTGAPAAVLAGVASSSILGLLSYVLVFRPLRKAPQLACVVASVGILTVLQSVVVIHFGSEQQVVTPFLSPGSISVAGQRVPVDRFEALAVLAAATLLLWTYFRFTRVGLATSAVAENERSISLLGYSPDRLALVAWAVSGASAGLFGVLIAPIVQLSAVNYTLFIVPALAAALVARFRSLPLTALVGLLLGVVQSIVVYLKGESWFPVWTQVGAEDALPLLVIVVALLWSSSSSRGRGEPLSARLPRVRRPQRLAPLLATVGLVGVLASVSLDGVFRFGFIQSVMAALVLLSFVLLTGYMGQISLAPVAIAGVSGIATARFADAWGIPFPLAPLLGALLAALVGLVVALPALRIRGIQLAVVTLAFAVATQSFVFGNPSLNPPGLPNLVGPDLFGLDLSVRSGSNIARVPFLMLCLAVLLIAITAVAQIARGEQGLRLLAVRSNERVAASVGIGVTGTKMLIFGFSSFLAGLGGALMIYSLGQFSAASFDTLAVGLPFLAFAYLGGITSISGALLAALMCPGGLLYVLLNNYMNQVGPYYLLVSGVGLVVTAMQYPEGVAGTVASLVERFVPRNRTKVRPSAPDRSDADILGLLVPAHSDGNAEGLHVGGVTVDYGGVRAVDNAEFGVRRGEVVGLIGPNGAGKTSLIDALSGFTNFSGRLSLDGSELSGVAPHAIVRAGVARTWQSPELFGDLTVEQNLVVADPSVRSLGSLAKGLVRSGRAVPERVPALLAFLGLSDTADRRPDELSLGQQKLVGIARMLMSQPAVLMLDEPAAGLDSVESRLLGTKLRELANTGVGLLLVEHDMDLVFAVCDRVVVIEFGRIIAVGTPAEIRTDPAVLTAYLGTDAPEPVLTMEAL